MQILNCLVWQVTKYFKCTSYQQPYSTLTTATAISSNFPTESALYDFQDRKKRLVQYFIFTYITRYNKTEKDTLQLWQLQTNIANCLAHTQNHPTRWSDTTHIYLPDCNATFRSLISNQVVAKHLFNDWCHFGWAKFTYQHENLSDSLW